MMGTYSPKTCREKEIIILRSTKCAPSWLYLQFIIYFFTSLQFAQVWECTCKTESVFLLAVFLNIWNRRNFLFRQVQFVCALKISQFLVALDYMFWLSVFRNWNIMLQPGQRLSGCFMNQY